jgi:hypothetical protein
MTETSAKGRYEIDEYIPSSFIAMKSKLIDSAALFLLMLVTGVFWGNMVYADSLNRNPFRRRIYSHRPNDYRKCGRADENPNAFLYSVCDFIDLVLSAKEVSRILLQRGGMPPHLISLLITLLVEVPIDNQIKTWTAETVPSDWQAMRDRWASFHTAGTFTSLASFGSLALAIIFPTREDLIGTESVARHR